MDAEAAKPACLMNVRRVGRCLLMINPLLLRIHSTGGRRVVTMFFSHLWHIRQNELLFATIFIYIIAGRTILHTNKAIKPMLDHDPDTVHYRN
jgi:hypothetical protein